MPRRRESEPVSEQDREDAVRLLEETTRVPPTTHVMDTQMGVCNGCGRNWPCPEARRLERT